MPADHKDLKIALFCGGAGTRMWPASRKDKPKQFQPLVKNLSTFEMMVERLAKNFPMQNIFPVTTRDNVGWVVKLAPNIPLENIIVESQMRDTAAAVGLAAVVLDKKFKNPNVLALWSDHVVKNENEFGKAIKLADDVAGDSGKFVEIGVRPTFPSVALGYLKVGKMLKNVDGLAVFEFVAQIEKPDFEMAKKFVESWEYLWHIGYALWPANSMLNQFKKHFPQAYASLVKIQKAWGTSKQEDVLRSEYPKIPTTSIDFAVNSKLNADDQVVISADLGWRDVGTWNELKDEMAIRLQDNVIQGDVIELDLKDCLVYSTSERKVIAAIGLEGLVIVDTQDALLVCSKDRTQDVKKVIEKLQTQKKDRHL